MGGVASLAGGMGGGGGKGGGQGGASNFDMGLIEQAIGQNIQALQNRYKQLGLGVPSGDPLQAALSGTSLTYAGPSTMEQQDVAAQRQIGQAGIGQVQANNITNPFAPGSPGNLNELANQQNQFQNASGSLAGAQEAQNTPLGGGGTAPGRGGGGGGLTVPGGTPLTGGGIRNVGTPAIG